MVALVDLREVSVSAALTVATGSIVTGLAANSDFAAAATRQWPPWLIDAVAAF
jgi:hypothetical protein